MSAPANPNTWLNNIAQTPMVATKDSTTVPMSRTGAVIDLSSSMRMRKITTSTTGMIRLRSV